MSKKVFLQNGSYIAFTSKSVRFYSSNEEELGAPSFQPHRVTPGLIKLFNSISSHSPKT